MIIRLALLKKYGKLKSIEANGGNQMMTQAKADFLRNLKDTSEIIAITEYNQLKKLVKVREESPQARRVT